MRTLRPNFVGTAESAKKRKVRKVICVCGVPIEILRTLRLLLITRDSLFNGAREKCVNFEMDDLHSQAQIVPNPSL